MRIALSYVLLCTQPLVLGLSAQTTVELKKVLEATAPQLSRWSKLALHQDGRLIAAPLDSSGVLFFEGSGSMRHEAMAVSNHWNVGLQWDGSEAVIFDSGRQTRFRLSSGSVVDEQYVPSGVSYRLMPTGTVVFTTHRRTPDRFGNPWHTIDIRGIWQSHGYSELDRSGRGGSSVLGPLAEPWLYEWKVVRTDASEVLVWTHYRDRFRIDAWTEAGELLQTIRDTPMWLGAYEDPERSLLGPSLHEVFLGGDTIWVLGRVVQEDWRDALPPDWEREFPTLSEQNGVFDTVIEVRERTQGMVLARTILEEFVHGFAAEGHVYALEDRDEGQIAAVVWRIELIQSQVKQEGGSHHVWKMRSRSWHECGSSLRLRDRADPSERAVR